MEAPGKNKLFHYYPYSPKSIKKESPKFLSAVQGLNYIE